MGYRLRELGSESKFSQALSVEALGRAVSQDTIVDVLRATGVQEQRERKLNLTVVVWLVIAMNIYTHQSVGEVMRKLARGLRYIWPDPEYPLPNDAALSYRRYQLGAQPLARLFHQVCRPMTTPQTPGAFLFGWRLMAIDGTTEDVPDTSANAAVFGRHHTGRGASAFPQVQAVYLAECGSHAVIDAGFWPCHTSERVGGRRMLRAVTPDMLVMIDRGFYEYDMLLGVRQRQAHVLARLPAHVHPKRVQSLVDGTYLADIAPSDYHRRKQGEVLRVRVVEYTITDSALPGYGEVHRLVTSLLDPTTYPALDLVCAYHERWEIELVVDEIDTHQRLSARTLRSLKPVGVIQELYALLIAHYAIRRLMHQAAVEAQIDPDRLSFVHAVQVIQDALPEFQMTAPEQLPQLYQRLLRDIAAKRLPERRPRSNPRVVKRKMSNFKLKRPQHYRWLQPARPFRQALALI